jgi:hypothetical protein
VPNRFCREAAPESMSDTSQIFIRRYPASYLSEIACCSQPMTTELAENIRTLRREHCVDYRRLGYYLCESDPDLGASFGLGKALVELAALHLDEDYRTCS